MFFVKNIVSDVQEQALYRAMNPPMNPTAGIKSKN
jgi:hypothetical protein